MKNLQKRNEFQVYPLNGGLLFFHPRSGTHLRFHGNAMQHFRRQAPRVVMFGITNDCNLRCHFCSRDTSGISAWTEDNAFELLSGLSQKGVLEVAFGGGEPFAFPAFAALVRRLHEETSLALHVTTNGTLLNPTMWADYEGRFGQVRVSIYNNATWKRCSELFQSTNQLWGVNLLVDDATLSSLPALLCQLSEAGCNDISLLGFIGEPTRVLSDLGKEKLAAIVQASPLPCRMSLCFGDQIPVSRLLAGYDNQGDCGAGSDFISITADKRMQSCSFMDTNFPVTTADQAIACWQQRSTTLHRASTRSGCARTLPQLRPIPAMPAFSVWQGFSGNNSGECVMVAKFQSPKKAEQYLDELLPGWRAVKSKHTAYGYPAQWVDLFRQEQVLTNRSSDYENEIPESLVAIGNSVLAVGYDAGDLFPELRALAWKRGAVVVAGGIHLHDDADVFSAIRCKSTSDRNNLRDRAHTMDTYVYGDTLFVHQARERKSEDTLLAIQTSLHALAQGRPLSSEIYFHDSKAAAIQNGLKALASPFKSQERLWIQFIGFQTGDLQATNEAFATTLHDQIFTKGDTWLLLDPVRARKRVAVLAYRRNATVTPLHSQYVDVEGYYWIPKIFGRKGKKEKQKVLPALEVVQKSLVTHGISLKDLIVEKRSDYNNAIVASSQSNTPGKTLLAMQKTAHSLGVKMYPTLSEPQPMASMLRRLLADVRAIHS